ncbi:MAG: hypothetical protein ACI87O_000510 [Planctomycetota bacterium]|jgi:hypothetical protein
MKTVANAVLYNVIWFVAVWFAAAGNVWLGPLAMGLLILLHFSWIHKSEWRREACFIVAVGVVGASMDSLLSRCGVLAYPSSESAWPYGVAPPWIACLWVGFATMPRFSLRWLGRFHWSLAAVFGALGGGLAFFSGTRLGAIESGMGGVTYAVLALEYATLTPLMMFAHRRLWSARPLEEVALAGELAHAGEVAEQGDGTLSAPTSAD